jgi:hypothetical protein
MTIRRMKTYTGEQGYVYQYYFVGKRAALAEPSTAEYIFDVSSDRKITFAVSVFLSSETVQKWATANGRELKDAEQYAAVKMRLFQGFDEVENMMAEGRALRIENDQLGPLLAAVGVL